MRCTTEENEGTFRGGWRDARFAGTLTGFLVEGPSLTPLPSLWERVLEREGGIRRAGFGELGGRELYNHPARMVLVALIMINIKVHLNRL